MAVFQNPSSEPDLNEQSPLGAAESSSAAPANKQGERQAVARLLSSGEFQRSPNLEKILNYLTEQYFLGKAQQIKEYSIATEALGRREDFDPKRDSIVRVEMHRLRKRLKEYYDTRGAEENIRILLPEKSYIPEFEKVIRPAQVLAAFTSPVEEEAFVPLKVHREVVFRTWVANAQHTLLRNWLLALLLGSGLVFAGLRLTSTEIKLQQPNIMENQPEAAAVGIPDRLDRQVSSGSDEIRILAGRAKGSYPDRHGIVWQGDEFFRGGVSVPVHGEVHTRGLDSNIFANKREGEFYYDIPLKPGSYEMRLLFAETSLGEGHNFDGGESQRTFHIHANGAPLLSGLDVVADANDLSAATVRHFKDIRPASDGKLHLYFQPSQKGKAFLNAILIRPGIPGKIKPIRIVSQTSSFVDSWDNQWEPDHYFHGGVHITRPMGAAIERDTDLVRGERYGKFNYTIPVPPGKYQARLYFWEYWFGPEGPGKGGIGSRVFDVFCNFRPLLTDLDILKRSPKTHFLMETFHGLEPNRDGKLVFDFVPKANYALINAIEIAEDDSVLEKR